MVAYGPASTRLRSTIVMSERGPSIPGDGSGWPDAGGRMAGIGGHVPPGGSGREHRRGRRPGSLRPRRPAPRRPPTPCHLLDVAVVGGRPGGVPGSVGTPRPGAGYRLISPPAIHTYIYVYIRRAWGVLRALQRTGGRQCRHSTPHPIRPVTRDEALPTAEGLYRLPAAGH